MEIGTYLFIFSLALMTHWFFNFQVYKECRILLKNAEEEGQPITTPEELMEKMPESVKVFIAIKWIAVAVEVISAIGFVFKAMLG
jgi:hypothetical protein